MTPQTKPKQRMPSSGTVAHTPTVTACNANFAERLKAYPCKIKRARVYIHCGMHKRMRELTDRGQMTPSIGAVERG